MSFFSKFFGKGDEKPSEYPEAEPRQEQPDVVYVPNDDDRMSLAIEKARDTIGYFADSLAQPKPGQDLFSLKVRLTDGVFSEHIWLSNPSCDNDGWYGTLNNEPYDLKNVKIGQRVGVSWDEVSDWMIKEDGELIGGYTIRAIRDGYDEEGQRKFDQSTGMRIGLGEDHYPHDDSTPEGAVLALEDAYAEKNWPKAASFKDFELEARNMLCRFGEAMLTQDIIAKTAETLQLSFLAYMAQNPPQLDPRRKTSFSWRKYISENEVLFSEIMRVPGARPTIDHHLCVNVNGHWKVCPVPREEGS